MEQFDYRSKVLEITTLLYTISMDVQDYLDERVVGKIMLIEEQVYKAIDDTIISLDKGLLALIDQNGISISEVEDAWKHKIGADFWPQPLFWRKEDADYAYENALLSYLTTSLHLLMCHIDQFIKRKAGPLDMNDANFLIDPLADSEELSKYSQNVDLEPEAHNLALLLSISRKFSERIGDLLKLSLDAILASITATRPADSGNYKYN